MHVMCSLDLPLELNKFLTKYILLNQEGWLNPTQYIKLFIVNWTFVHIFEKGSVQPLLGHSPILS